MRKVHGVAALLFVAPSAFSVPPVALPEPLPVPVSAERWRPLRDHHDQVLEQQLERLIQANSERRILSEKGKLGVGLVDLTDPAEPRFAHVNGDVMMYAASLPKIAVLLAAHGAIEEGSLQETPQVRSDMSRMIRVSSNSAATSMIERLGFQAISEFMMDPRFKLYDPRQGGGLWVGKRFAKRGERIGDPMKNISHAASATQVARLYYLLATGKAFNPDRSERMLQDLSKPGINHHFVGVLRRRAPKAALYRKSGTWSQWRADSVLVWGPKRRYILVGLTEGASKQVLPDLVPIAEEAMASSQRVSLGSDLLYARR